MPSRSPAHTQALEVPDQFRRDDRDFHAALHDWMSRTPWFAISALAHLLAFFVLAAVPWNDLAARDDPIVVRVAPEPDVDPPLEPEPEPEPPVELPPEELIEPELVTVSDPVPADTLSDEADAAPGDPDLFALAMPDADDALDEIGVGGGGLGDGKRGARFGPGGSGGGGTGRDVAVLEGLAWLAAHQAVDGSWSAAGFSNQCGALGATVCDGEGSPVHDVGVTALALLAFLGDGHTTNVGDHQEQVRRGIDWLRRQQDPDNGLIGTRSSMEFLYDHTLATLALAEAYGFSQSPVLRAPCQRAVDFIQRARNPYGAWRYDVPGNGMSDTSVTGWVVFALQTASDSGLRVDPAALQGALSFLDEVTGSDGRTGYTQAGQGSSRVPGVNDWYPREANETLTAVSLLCRVFLGQDPGEEPLLLRQAEIVGRALPRWDAEGLSNDLYGWYYGTYALYQVGAHGRGKRIWAAWDAALEGALSETRRVDGDARGSWDPIGPWGHSGGRVYSTALGVLTLEVRVRYARLR